MANPAHAAFVVYGMPVARALDSRKYATRFDGCAASRRAQPQFGRIDTERTNPMNQETTMKTISTALMLLHAICPFAVMAGKPVDVGTPSI